MAVIKGVNHTIIEVPDPNSRYFDRALLFVRPELYRADPQHLQRDARQWIGGLGQPPRGALPLPRRRKRKRWPAALLWWGLGALAGLAAGWWLF